MLCTTFQCQLLNHGGFTVCVGQCRYRNTKIEPAAEWKFLIFLGGGGGLVSKVKNGLCISGLFRPFRS